MNMPARQAATGRGVRLALVLSVALLVIAGIAFYYASRQAHEARKDDDAVVVRVLADRCEPAALTVPAGRTTFRIVNESSRAVEWEILDGVMVIEERENIAPGFHQLLSTHLSPGRYDMTCGLLSNPRGSLTVTATEASEAARTARPKLVEFVGALAEYRVFLAAHADALVRETNALAQAVDARDMVKAAQAYRAAYSEYALIEPAAGAYADLATRMDGQAAYFEQREADPEFRGFRRLDPLIAQAQPGPDLAPLAKALAADAQSLRERLLATTLPPDRMASGAARTIAQLAGGSTTGLNPDIASMRARSSLLGARKVFDLLKPFIDRRDPARGQSIDQAFQQASIDAQPSPQKAWQSLADQLEHVGAALGYE